MHKRLPLIWRKKPCHSSFWYKKSFCKEQDRLHPEEGAPDNEKDFPLLHRYMMFHTQLIALEKNSQDRQEGFVLFSDIYAQTVTYGLLAARWLSKDRDIDFTRINIPSLLPITSKFLKKYTDTACWMLNLLYVCTCAFRI